MSYLTRNILDFYKINESNSWYLTKYLSNSNYFGRYAPYAENIFSIDKNDNDSFVGTVDEHNTYQINQFGLRGEVDENAEVIVSGCSITFGVGVPYDGTWAKFLSTSIGKSVINLGNPGASVENICNDIVSYSINNKMPKEVFCLFPDFFRSMVVVDKEFYKSKKFKKGTVEDDHLELTYCGPTINQYEDSLFMQIKDHKYIEDSKSPHQLILDSINSIWLLESFCLSNNIKLYWSTWDLPSSLIMQELINLKGFKLKNFTMFYPPKTETSCQSFIDSICESHHGSEFKDNIGWDIGCDYAIVDHKKIFDNAHPGIHFHYHVADFFYNLSSK